MADYKDSVIYERYTRSFQALITTNFSIKTREWMIVPVGDDEEHHYKWLASSYFVRDLCNDATTSAQYGFYTVLPYLTMMWEEGELNVSTVRKRLDGKSWRVLFRSGVVRDDTDQSRLYTRLKSGLARQLGTAYEIIEGIEEAGKGFVINNELRHKLEEKLSDDNLRKSGVFKKR
ncbi:TPA: hypothetical protein H1011_01955 [archaeon]|uniref:Uncharacterized protein n=1 Tax=Candidatus Undinarchaeum marinum TaxID=2756141 RepID=A0A832UYF7_9ARCH|nr:hypothetical protein [Candidatus Undinarchaeum marinum]